MIENSSIRD